MTLKRCKMTQGEVNYLHDTQMKMQNIFHMFIFPWFLVDLCLTLSVGGILGVRVFWSVYTWGQYNVAPYHTASRVTEYTMKIAHI